VHEDNDVRSGRDTLQQTMRTSKERKDENDV